MSTRERWIVYPILFMTLGIALRDKIIRPTHLGSGDLQLGAGEITTGIDSAASNCKWTPSSVTGWNLPAPSAERSS